MNTEIKETTLKKNNITLITLTLILLGVYNVMYWSAKIFDIFPVFHKSVMGHWRLITFLEFLAVASVAVDFIIRFDHFDKKERNIRMAITGSIGFLFFLRLILGVIELYMRGEVR